MIILRFSLASLRFRWSRDSFGSSHWDFFNKYCGSVCPGFPAAFLGIPPGMIGYGIPCNKFQKIYWNNSRWILESNVKKNYWRNNGRKFNKTIKSRTSLKKTFAINLEWKCKGSSGISNWRNQTRNSKINQKNSLWEMSGRASAEVSQKSWEKLFGSILGTLLREFPNKLQKESSSNSWKNSW